MSNAIDMDWQFFAGPPSVHMKNLVYWVLSPKASIDHKAFSADFLKYKLSSQCDTEDQASVGDNDCVGDPDFFNPSFYPIAPVQFVSSWSPLPFLVHLIGEPVFVSVSGGELPCAVCWFERCPFLVTGMTHPSTSLQRRLERRVEDVVRAAFSRSPLIGIVFQAGWSYDRRHLPALVRSAIRAHGFVFDSRSPV